MHKLISKLSPSLLITTLALGTILTVPVLADQGGSDSTSSNSEPTNSEVSGSGSASESQTTEPSSTTDTKGATEAESEAHAEGAAMVESLGKNHGKHTEAERMTFCEAHKSGITTKFGSINTEMAGFQSRIDNILAKVQAYQQSNNVTVSNWAALLAAAKSAQTKSADALAALKSVTPSLDCNSTSVAQDIATFKAAAQLARDDLQAYKSAAQALLEALMGAKHTSTTQGGNQ